MSKLLWDAIKQEDLREHEIPFSIAGGRRRRTGSFMMHSYPVHREGVYYSLAIVKQKYEMYSIWITSEELVCTRLIQNRLREHLKLPKKDVWVFNKLRVDRRKRYHICNGTRSLYFTDLENGGCFSQSQLVVEREYIAFRLRMQRQFERFIIQQTY